MADATLKIAVDAKEAERNLARFADNAERATKGLEKSFGLLKGAAAGAFAFIAGRAVIGAMGDFVRAAQEQEQALQNVATAMARTGEFSQGAFDDVRAFADGLQDLKGVSDDAALSAFALAKSFGASNDQAKKAVDAAVELSAATGKSLDEAIKQVSKTFGGLAGELGEVNPAVKRLTEEQLKAGAAADILLKQFGGTAASQLNTFSGSVTKTSNAFGDLQESIGEVFTKNSAVVEIVKGFGEAFKVLKSAIDENKGTFKKFVGEFALGLAKQIPPILVSLDTLIKAFDILADKRNSVRTFFDTVALSIGFVTDEALALTETLLRIEKFAAKFAPKGSPLNPLGGFGEVGNGQQGPAGTKIGDEQLVPSAVDNAAEAAKAIADLEARIASLQKLREENRTRNLDVADGGAAFAAGSRPAADTLLLKLADGFQDVIEGIQRGLERGAIETPSAGQGLNNPIPVEISNPTDPGSAFDFSQFFDIEGFLRGLKDGLAEIGVSTAKSFFSNIAKGQEGSAKFVAEVGGSIASAIGGPAVGGAFSAAIEILGQDPEAFAPMINGFLEGIPTIIDNIVENIPTLVVAIAKNAGPIITALLGAVPKVIVALAEAMPEVAYVLIEQLAGGVSYQISRFTSGADIFFDDIQQAGERFSDYIDSLGPKIEAFFLKIGSPIEDAAKAFFNIILDAANTIIQPLKDFVNALNPSKEGGFISRATSGIKEAAKGERGIFTGKKGSLLAKGGTIPPGFDKDTFPAFLSSGELVVPRDDVVKLREFIEGFDKNEILRGQTGKRRKKLEGNLNNAFRQSIGALFGIGDTLGKGADINIGSGAAAQAVQLAGAGDVTGLRSLTSSLGLNDGNALGVLKTILTDAQQLSAVGEDAFTRLIKDVNAFNADKSNTEGMPGGRASSGVSSAARSFAGGGSGSIVDETAEELRNMRNQDAQAYTAIIQALQALAAQPTEVTSKVEFNANTLADIILQLSRRNARTAA